METIVSPVGRGQGNELVNKLEDAGLDSVLAQKVIDSKGNDLAAKVVRMIRNGGFEPSTSQKRAREIMGANMFGIEEAIKHFGFNPSPSPYSAFLANVPFTEEVLTSLKDTYLLVAVFPFSILEIRDYVKADSVFYNQDWYNKQAFAKDTGNVGWQLVRKTPVEGSLSKTWEEQQVLLYNDYETPKAQVMVYSIIGHYKATGERLFEKVWVRCSDCDSDGHRVNVGFFDDYGLFVNSNWGDYRNSSLGVASARKF